MTAPPRFGRLSCGISALDTTVTQTAETPYEILLSAASPTGHTTRQVSQALGFRER